jgi:ectoine hydroxylase-related dioxygenase (phytanoyl-CoA dioxygenase family)
MIDEIVAALDRDGYAVIPDAIGSEQVATATAELEVILQSTPTGRDDFEGRRTQRVYALFAKTRSLDAMATHPLVLAVLDHVLGHYQLSAPAAIAIGPGESAQALHSDDAIYPIARPHCELVVNVMWPLEQFTEANGATRIVPGSHRSVDLVDPADGDPGPDRETVAVEMSAGSALIYLGSVWHGGGANRTDKTRLGVVLHYAVGWLRPVESHLLAVRSEIVGTLPARLQELLGYNICPPFIGYVDGRHPRKLLTSPAVVSGDR